MGRTLERKRFMGPIMETEKPELSDPEAVARFMLKKGYRTALHTIEIFLDKTTDNEQREHFRNTLIWINILGRSQ